MIKMWSILYVNGGSENEQSKVVFSGRGGREGWAETRLLPGQGLLSQGEGNPAEPEGFLLLRTGGENPQGTLR